MPIEIHEARESWGWNVWREAENIANTMKASERPFYIVFAAKSDRHYDATFRQAFKIYKAKPPLLMGLLVWNVDESGDFLFVPELSSPPDVPLDPSLLSDKASDASARVAAQGEKLKALVS